MRKQLSMKRLSMLSANFLIHLAHQTPKGTFSKDEAEYAQAIVQPIMMDFLRYCWEHKDDDSLFELPKIEKKK